MSSEKMGVNFGEEFLGIEKKKRKKKKYLLKKIKMLEILIQHQYLHSHLKTKINNHNKKLISKG